ncbi:MAG: alpha/beta hydrolase [Pseudomonadota bacterium]|nr:alpha/beta hydrolase [Pseudomonadota bacterium]
MPAIDYEVEYNNRARVPEHAAIFERWQKEAAAYRDEASREKRAELGLSYGPSQRQTLDIFAARDAAKAPLALFIHGGYWRSLEPRIFSHMARGLNARGIGVAVAGYDLCPQVKIGQIIEQVRQATLLLHRRFNKRITVYGHSAGGHLAACLLATDWKALDPKAPADLVLAAYAISGVFDLAPLIGISMNQDLRLDEQQARAASPIFWPPPTGGRLDAVVGGLESSEFLRQSHIIAEAWRQSGAETRYEAVPRANHFTVIDPLADANSEMVERLVALCGRTEGGR